MRCPFCKKEMNKLKKALIFGISGQDGKYLTDELIKKIIVHGFVRRKKLIKIKLKK